MSDETEQALAIGEQLHDNVDSSRPAATMLHLMTIFRGYREYIQGIADSSGFAVDSARHTSYNLGIEWAKGDLTNTPWSGPGEL